MTSIASDTIFRSALGLPSVDCTPLSVTGTSAIVQQGGGDYTMVKGGVYRFLSTELCHVQFAAAPTATTNMFPIPPYTPVFLTATAAVKIAAIRNSTTGTLYVSLMAEAGLR